MENNNLIQKKENVFAGIVGALLFSFVGGALWVILYQFGYLAGISGLVGVVCAIKGYKIFAKKDMRRVPEKVLFTLGFLGGAFFEYVTMKLIRHKTLHKRFMIGLPLIVLLQVAVAFAYLYFLQK